MKPRGGSGIANLHHEAERLFRQIVTMEDGPKKRDLIAAITSQIEESYKPTDSTEPEPVAPNMRSHLVKRLEAAWTIEYKDPTSNTDRLHRHLSESYEKWRNAVEGFYAPYFAVFQSSGHGKSRLLQELCTSRQIPHLYICFRPALSSGYPLRTRDIADFLTQNPSQKKWDAFLRAVLSVFCEVTKMERDSAIAYKMWESYKQKAGSLEAMICTKAKELQEVSSIVPLDHLQPSPFLFVIDEARELVTATDEFGLSSFRMLRRGLSTYGMGIFAILMDTLASIANFTPTVENDPSFRDGNPKKLFPPFHLVVNVDMFAKPAATAADVKKQLEPCNLVTKGRILWASTILGRKRAALTDEESSRSTDEELLSATTFHEWNRIVALAAMKLVGGRNEWSVGALSRAASLSVLSARAQVSIAPASDSSSVAVGSHLATCVSISEDRDAVFSLFPSEPAVAAGAFLVVWAHTDPELRQKASMNNYAKLLSHLQTSLVQGVVDAGQCGELVARLLLNIAWDLSVGSVAKFYTMITLEDFLNNLIGSARLDQAKQVLGNKTILGAQLCFTHFIPISYVPNEQDLVKLMSRGAAAICQRNQVGVDLMIPLLLADNVMSVFLISVKNHQSQFDSSWPSSAGSRVSLQTVCPKLLNQAHFFTLLMQLGARRSMVFAGQHNEHSALAVFALDTFCPAIDVDHVVRRNLHAILKARQGIEGVGFDELSRKVVPNLVPLHWTAEAPPPRHDLSVSAGNISSASSSDSPTVTSGDASPASFRLLDVVSRTWWTLDGTSKTTTHEVIALFQQRGLAATVLRPSGSQSRMKRVLQPVELQKCIETNSGKGMEVIYITISADDLGLVCTFPVSAEPFSADLRCDNKKTSKELPSFVKDYLTKLVKTQQKRTGSNKRKRDEESDDNETESVAAEGTSENFVRTRQKKKQSELASKKIPRRTVKSKSSGVGAQEKKRPRKDDK